MASWNTSSGPRRCSRNGRASRSSKVAASHFAYPLLSLTLSQVAPVLPYLLLVLVLIFRPRGLMGKREG